MECGESVKCSMVVDVEWWDVVEMQHLGPELEDEWGFWKARELRENKGRCLGI